MIRCKSAIRFTNITGRRFHYCTVPIPSVTNIFRTGPIEHSKENHSLIPEIRGDVHMVTMLIPNNNQSPSSAKYKSWFGHSTDPWTLLPIFSYVRVLLCPGRQFIITTKELLSLALFCRRELGRERSFSGAIGKMIFVYVTVYFQDHHRWTLFRERPRPFLGAATRS